MGLRGQVITITDPGIPKATNSQQIPLVIGIADSGSTTEIETITSPEEALETYGVGPLSRDLAHILRYGGRPARALRLAQASAGTCGAVTQSGSGPAMTVLTATAKSRWRVRVEVTTGGALGTVQVRYSLDAWDTVGLNPKWSLPQVVPGSGEVTLEGTGIGVGLAAGTHVVGTTHTFETFAPEFDPTDIAALESTLTAYLLPWRFLVVAGDPVDVDDAYDIAANCDTLLEALAVTGEFKRSVVGAGLESDSAVIASGLVTTLEARRVSVLYGEAQVDGAVPINPGEGKPRIPAHIALAARIAGSLISTDPGRVASGPLPGVRAITHDERVEQTLCEDTIRIGALRTRKGRAGFFVEKAWIRGPQGSDFKYYQHGAVMDLACEVARLGQEKYEAASLRTETVDGPPPMAVLSREDAQTIQEDVEAQLLATIGDASRKRGPLNAEGNPGHCSRFEYEVLRTNDVLADETFYTEIGIQPLFYPNTIRTTLGYKILTTT